MNQYYQQQRVAQSTTQRGVSPYQIVRAHQSPNSRLHSPSPEQRNFRTHQYPAKQPGQSPGKIQYYAQSPHKVQITPMCAKFAPSQVYYTTSKPQVIRASNQARQLPEEYNVWEGYDSKTDITYDPNPNVVRQQILQFKAEAKSSTRSGKQNKPNYAARNTPYPFSIPVRNIQDQGRLLSPSSYECCLIPKFK